MKHRLACLIALLSGLLPIAVQGEGYWDRRLWMAQFTTATKLATDGAGKLLMSGGSLSVFNPNSSGVSVGSWDGHHWTALSARPPVDLVGSDGVTWLAGLPGTNSVTQVNPGGQSVVLPAVAGSMLTLTVDGVGLLAGGEFVAGPGNTATNVARWNGTNWEALGGGVPGKVVKLSATEGGLFAGIAESDVQPATVWHWDGTVWSQLGPISGEDLAFRQIKDLVWYGGRLIAAVSSITNAAVLAWTGDHWEPYGSSKLTGTASSLAVFQGDIYVAGSGFSLEGLTHPLFGVARLTDGQWRPVEYAPGVAHTGAPALVATRDELFIISFLPLEFGLTNGNLNHALWQFDGHDWWLHGNGLASFDIVNDVKASPSGMILSVSGGVRNYPGTYGFVWDGFFLKTLGVSPPEPGANLTLGNRTVATPAHIYRQASRSPTTPAGANLVARLEGTNWVAFTAPMTLNIKSSTALAADGETIYVSGTDDAMTGKPVAVARWQNAAWERLGGYFGNGALQALDLFGGQPVAGGAFKTIAGLPVTNLARWDGIAWQPVTPAPDGPISAFARRGNDLVVVGSFTNIGGIAARGVALWTATGWQSLADGLGLVAPSTVAVREDGTIAVCGSLNPNTSEAWVRHQTIWEPIGQTFGDKTVNALQWQGHDLFVAGLFYGMGDVEAGRFAIWHDTTTDLILSQSADGSYPLHWDSGHAGTLVLERGPLPNQLSPWLTNSPLSLHRDFTNQPAPGSAQEFYRARLTE